MNSTRSSISKFGFKFDDPQNQACILDGRSEAAYAWITVNYLSGVFIQVMRSNFFIFQHSRCVDVICLCSVYLCLAVEAALSRLKHCNLIRCFRSNIFLILNDLPVHFYLFHLSMLCTVPDNNTVDCGAL